MPHPFNIEHDLAAHFHEILDREMTRKIQLIDDDSDRVTFILMVAGLTLRNCALVLEMIDPKFDFSCGTGDETKRIRMLGALIGEIMKEPTMESVIRKANAAKAAAATAAKSAKA